jgi:hypothetical protein
MSTYVIYAAARDIEQRCNYELTRILSQAKLGNESQIGN